jgi:uncharacterized protein YbjT (DUF2867 family)
VPARALPPRPAADLLDRRTLRSALEGVESVYFTWPVAPGIVEAAANLVSAGKTTGLKRVVVMSMGAARPESPSALARAQWMAEEVIGWSGISNVSLRIAAFFYENLALLHRADIEGDGVLRNSFADVAMGWIAAEDAAKLAVAALLDRSLTGALYPTGGHTHSHAELARMLGDHLRRPLRHETISPAEWERRLVAAGDPRITPAMAAHISVLGAAVKGPRPGNDLFEILTGEKPLSFVDALRSGRLFSR